MFFVLVLMISFSSCQKQEMPKGKEVTVPVVKEEKGMESSKADTTVTKEDTEEEAKAEIATYEGHWFTIKYPAEFTASPTTPMAEFRSIQQEAGTPTRTFVDTDEATFTSPDGEVVFYVFSPQWGGEPDYLLVKDTEKLVDEKMSEEGKDGDKKTLRWATIAAKDGSYTRSYLSTKMYDDTVHYVVGIQYEDQAAYDDYKEEYEAFKKSLVQYAD
jgi:hypothetical protein